MRYFTDDYIEFFKDLGNNNNREWFQANKKRYESSVKKPFKAFTQALIDKIAEYDSRILIEPKQAISRINRDIRFSADKTPYNLHLNAFIAPNGKKDPINAGFAVRLAPDMLGIMGGMYMLSKEQLLKLRSELAEGNTELRSLIEEQKFSSRFGEVRGDKMKRIPKDLKTAAEKEPLILLKQFYYMREESADLIASNELMPTLIENYTCMKPVNDYLTKLIN